ncbi:twin-arginine translocation pathway signal protein [Melaminivora suipulveris]|uniref:Twin-arginine translocation pathway signal protein n=1 Tax=Melaminivora suipulveris TaxID=2109913 RepID=A0A2R3QFH6_9BURK|nr:ABC transporter substrate-binding protein [Melaminivora suipulveris]AVO50525.1 twin-arginine translocation pathway signal protein [Melaminivora suipulveris]
MSCTPHTGRLGAALPLHAAQPRRRALLQAASVCAVASALPTAFAQEGQGIAVAQIVDLSAQQQDVSRDFLTGSRAAWADFNGRGGLRGRPVQHLVLETDGSPAGLRAAWQAAQAHPACVAFSGCAGDGAAAAIAALQAGGGMAHAAPWLHRQWHDEGDTVFGIFPDYQAQIAHAVRSLAVMGVQQAGVVFAHASVQQQLQASVVQAGTAMGLRTQVLSAADRRAAPPAIVLFVGGTPELHAYVSRLVMPPGRQCYVVALADVNLQVLAQMGGTRPSVPVIATQPVPLLSSSLPIVRAYRAVLGRLYDEPPSPQGLAGFIAARYTAEVLGSVSGPLSRASVLAAFRKRPEVQLGGYAVAYQGGRLASATVTQSMLTADGRIVG